MRGARAQRKQAGKHASDLIKPASAREELLHVNRLILRACIMSVMLILSPGAEEMETVIPVDVLRRAEVSNYILALIV